MSTTRINDNDLASVALYDKVNAIANEIDEEKTNYSDFNRLNNEVVKLTGNQTVDGVKTFTKGIVGTLQNYYAYNTDSNTTPWKKVMSLTVTGTFQTVLIPFVLTGYGASDNGIALGNISVRVEGTAGTLSTANTKILFSYVPEWVYSYYDFKLLYKNNQGNGSSVLVEFWVQVKGTYRGVCLIILDEKQGGASKLNRSTRSWYNNPTGVASLPSDYSQIAYELEFSYARTPATSSNNTAIATTAWFNSKIQTVSTLPASPNANVIYLIP